LTTAVAASAILATGPLAWAHHSDAVPSSLVRSESANGPRKASSGDIPVGTTPVGRLTIEKDGYELDVARETAGAGGAGGAAGGGAASRAGYPQWRGTAPLRRDNPLVRY